MEMVIHLYYQMKMVINEE